jgi:hypothetical protein
MCAHVMLFSNLLLLLLLLQVGTRALQGNMTKLGPKVLPVSEQLLFAGEKQSKAKQSIF